MLSGCMRRSDSKSWMKIIKNILWYVNYEVQISVPEKMQISIWRICRWMTYIT